MLDEPLIKKVARCYLSRKLLLAIAGQKQLSPPDLPKG